VVSDAPPSTSDAPTEPGAPVDGTEAREPDARDGGVEVSDARNFGDSLLTCGHRVFDFEWTKPIGMGHWFVLHGSPATDTAANELLLPFDSGVEDVALDASNYYLEFDLSIDGDLTFFASPGAIFNDEPMPAITRSGSELVFSTLTTGATKTVPAGGFQGQRIPAQKVHVVLFGEAYPERLGLEVIAGGQTFWSGFTVLSSPPEVLNLVAANLPAEAGTTARIHIGPISGCQIPFFDPCKRLDSGFCPVDGGAGPPF
jgi:hypothetical protein